MKQLPDWPTRDEIVAYLRDLAFWQVQGGADMCRCTAGAREVKIFDRRGRRRR